MAEVRALQTAVFHVRRLCIRAPVPYPLRIQLVKFNVFSRVFLLHLCNHHLFTIKSLNLCIIETINSLMFKHYIIQSIYHLINQRFN